MTDSDLAKICNDVTSIAIIIDRLNEIGDALEVIESLPWPGADLEDITDGQMMIQNIRDDRNELVRIVRRFKLAWCEEHGIETFSTKQTPHTPHSDASLKAFGQRLKEKRMKEGD